MNDENKQNMDMVEQWNKNCTTENVKALMEAEKVYLTWIAKQQNKMQLNAHPSRDDDVSGEREISRNHEPYNVLGDRYCMHFVMGECAACIECEEERDTMGAIIERFICLMKGANEVCVPHLEYILRNMDSWEPEVRSSMIMSGLQGGVLGEGGHLGLLPILKGSDDGIIHYWLRIAENVVNM